jgi:hypothetical protein
MILKIIFILYLIGVGLTFLFFKKFGKRIGFDYDVEKTYANQDDWNSNAEAYTAFSIGWPVMIPILCLFGFFHGLVRLAKYLL